MLHCTWMGCWIANDTHLFCANCFPTDRVISNWNRCSHIHWPIYLLHWNMDQKTEIRSYIKCRIRLNIDSKQIFNELCGIYEPQTISMRIVFRWVKAFKAGIFSVEDDTFPGKPSLCFFFVLRFYGPVNPMGSCRAWSVYLTTRLMGRLSPLSG